MSIGKIRTWHIVRLLVCDNFEQVLGRQCKAQIYIRWCCIDLSNAPANQDVSSNSFLNTIRAPGPLVRTTSNRRAWK
jgi:hypothetical protein